MSDPGMNIYSRCRREAGFTQEQAAELLDCGVRTLASWETGVYRPSDEKVLLMCQIYRTPMLAAEHLSFSSGIAQSILPQLKELPMAQAALGLLGAIRAFTAAESDWTLIEIAADGRISPEERKSFQRLMGQLEAIVEAAYELRLCREAQGAGHEKTGLQLSPQTGHW